MSEETNTAKKSLQLLLTSLVVVCLIVAVAIAVLAPSPGDEPWAKGKVPVLGAAFEYPATWHIQYVEESIGNAGLLAGVVSNIGRDLQHPDQGPNAATSAWDLSDLPSDAVVISIEHVDAIGSPPEPDDRFPVSLADGTRLHPTQFSGDTETTWVEFTLNGRLMGARVYIGTESSVEDQQIASRIVASIHPV